MNGMTLTKGKIVAAGAALVVALLAVSPAAWAQPATGTAGTPTSGDSPTATPSITVITNPGAQQATTTVTGTATATVGNSNVEGGVSLIIPAGSMPPGSTVTVTQEPALAGFIRREAESSVFIIPTFMNLEAVDSDGNPITAFDEPVTVRVKVWDAAWDYMRSAAGTTPTVKVQNTNNATGEVTEVTCTVVDLDSGVVDCALPHFSEWELIIEFAAGGLTPEDIANAFGSGDGPVTPAPADTGTGPVATEGGSNSNLGLLLGIAVALAAAGGLGARFAVKRARVE